MSRMDFAPSTSTAPLAACACPGAELWWADLGEPGLRGSSVVDVTQISTLDRRSLHARIGRLSAATLRQVDDGVRLVWGLSSLGQ